MSSGQQGTPTFRSAAVTGASRGIGRATALELARRGYRVFALARSEAQLGELALEASRRGLQVTPVVMDIGDDTSRQRAVARILDETGGYGLDVLVNNAGYGQIGPLEEISLDKLRQQFEVNVVGQLTFTQPFLSAMRDRRHGSIVNVSSVAGRSVAPFSGVYAASKSAIEALSDALRLELRPFGVRVIVIEPGPIRTAFSEVSRTTVAEQPISAYAPFIRRFEEGRKGWYLFERSPESVARTIGRAVQSEHPRSRYTVTVPAKVTTATRRLVPDLVMDWFMGRAMGAGKR
ncbi:MAG: oxidoreductase [Chloroflexota bacterium]